MIEAIAKWKEQFRVAQEVSQCYPFSSATEQRATILFIFIDAVQVIKTMTVF